MRDKVRGSAWSFGDDMDTDQILPAEYLVTPDPVELAKHAFEKARPEFATQVRPGDVIVAGENFGCGSSREHAPRALLGAGIACVVAKSFARIFFRNSINLGLPLVEADIEADDGDSIAVDFEGGRVENSTKKVSATFRPYEGFLKTLIDKGGLIPYARQMIELDKRSGP